MPAPRERLAAWHFREGAIERLLPPWESIREVRNAAGIANGSTVCMQVRTGLRTIDWIVQHERVEPGRGFTQRQVSGPFADWLHEFRFLPHEDGRSTIEEHVAYREPFGLFGSACCGGRIQKRLTRILAWRHRRLANDVRRHEELSQGNPLRVAVSGASGLVGKQCCAFLSSGGHQVRRIVRGEVNHERLDVAWNTQTGTVDGTALDGVDAVVHFAGENIAAGSWTADRKRAIRQSRVNGTRQIAMALAALPHKPRVLICASGVGWYGSRGTEPLDETSGAGTGFLSQTCQEWEQATLPAEQAGIRVVHLRIGLVVTAAGGVIKRLRTPFSLGLGGPVGSGTQGMSWIALDDLLAATLHCIQNESLRGAVNAVAPDPRSNRAFGAALGQAMHRPAITPLPAAAVSLIFGEMGRELLLGGNFVQPQRLLDSGFRFDHARLEQALAFEFGHMD